MYNARLSHSHFQCCATSFHSTQIRIFIFTIQQKKKPEERSKKRVRESSIETNNSSRKGRANSVSSDDVKEAKRDRKEDKGKTGFEKGLKAEKIIGKLEGEVKYLLLMSRQTSIQLT